MATFRVGDLRATQKFAKVSQMKAASEGSEVYLTWPASVASNQGKVLTVTADKVTIQFPGRKQTYPLVRRQKNGGLIRSYPHVRSNDTVFAGATVVASVLPEMAPVECPATTPYDFTADLAAPDRETVYAAVKALGFLPELQKKSIPHLSQISANHSDRLVRLEAAAALARLGEDDGWAGLVAALAMSDSESELRMEACLTLGELPSPRAIELLSEAAEHGDGNDLRCAAVWGLGNLGASIGDTPLLTLVSDEVEEIATHAIVTVTRLLNDGDLKLVLDQIGPNAKQAAAIVRAVRDSRVDFVPEVVGRIQEDRSETRQWLIYLLASAGRTRSEAYLRQSEPKLLHELEFFWRFQTENWTSRVDVSDQLQFLADQILD
ncbi:MAG: HEAT repeat domain-containing protein [Planctomycetota bacterium]|nr:HEAT repeat domain-containing protein [Planctomycetota bacterium]